MQIPFSRKQKILVTGSRGLVGSKFVADFSKEYDFETLDISDPINPIDITDERAIYKTLFDSDAKFIVNLAAFTNVTEAWNQTGDTNGLAYLVNVKGTENIVRACQRTNKHLIHISTAYVFDGKRTTPYREDDTINPIEWYGETKALAEERVMDSSVNWTILRIDRPFRSDNFPRPDAVRSIVRMLKSDSPHPLFTNHYMGPTFIDDFAKVIDWVIRTKATGIYHSSSGEKWSDYDFGVEINSALNLNKNIQPGDLKEYLKTLNRPYQQNTSLSSAKLKNEIDFKMLSVKEALSTVKIN